MEGVEEKCKRLKMGLDGRRMEQTKEWRVKAEEGQGMLWTEVGDGERAEMAGIRRRLCRQPDALLVQYTLSLAFQLNCWNPSASGPWDSKESSEGL